MNQRERFEACARLLGYDSAYAVPFEAGSDAHILALARAARLDIFYSENYVQATTPNEYGTVDFTAFDWPSDGTESECIIRAAAAVQIERETQQ